MVYIRQSQLPKLKEYKYSGIDHSLLSRYILKPYWWSQVIKLFPLSIAWVCPRNPRTSGLLQTTNSGDQQAQYNYPHRLRLRHN